MNYEKLAVAAKNAARDILRTNWIMNLLGDRREQEINLKNLEKDIEVQNKNLAIAIFVADKAKEENDPRAEDRTKELEEIQKNYDRFIEITECKRKNIERTIEDINERIKKVSKGESKVSYEEMTELANEIIEKKITSEFIEKDYEKEE